MACSAVDGLDATALVPPGELYYYCHPSTRIQARGLTAHNCEPKPKARD